MQKLEKRNTYTPTDASQVRSNCEQSLKVLRRGNGAPASKTFSNNPDATLTDNGQSGQNLRVTVVYVLNMYGDPLMPCKPRKARVLLKQGKAKVVKRTPFTIKLNYPCGGNKQEITLGVDAGYSKVGISAVSEKKELFSAEFRLRRDMVKLNSERAMYRRNRRGRKTWHRKPRFLNRAIPKGWLAPSIQHKLDSHVKIVEEIRKILPINEVVVEVAAFDVQKIKNPNTEGKEYQEGEQLGFWNVREYVLFRDGHKCRHCKGKSKDKVLTTHHLKSRQTGGDRPDNLLTLCKTCHDDYHKGLIEIKVPPLKGFKAEAFMNMVRWKIVDKLKELGTNAEHTYGYITKSNRIEMQLPKSHLNDAFVIAGGFTQQRSNSYLIKQVRRCNRKLFR